METYHHSVLNQREAQLSQQNGPPRPLRRGGRSIYYLPTVMTRPSRSALLLGFVVCAIVALGLAIIIIASTTT